MPEQSFEDRYRSYQDLLRDNTPSLTELGAIERQLGRLNHDMLHADIGPDRRLALLELRNETMTMLNAAMHRARIDEARAVVQAARAVLAPERRAVYPRQAPSPSSAAVRRRPEQGRDRGISR